MTVQVFKRRAPAKINLFLEVLGRRSDGFHELDTVFIAIDLWDELRVDYDPRGEGLALSVSDPSLPDGPENLVWRALEPELRRRSGGFEVFLKKGIPAGGGLGGGSSDAAAALLLAQEIFGEAQEAELSRRALELGSDVPFFLKAGCQRGAGRGEMLQSLPAWSFDLVLVTPGLHCPTPQVFKSLTEEDRSGPRRDPSKLLRALENQDPQGLAAALFNRLEGPAFKLWPELEAIKSSLMDAGCLGAVMSGSGSSVFGITANSADAWRVAANIPNSQVLRAIPDANP